MPALAAALSDTVDDGLAGCVGDVVGGCEASAGKAGGGGTAGYGGATLSVPSEGGGEYGTQGFLGRCKGGEE